jgi:hypothetical protein
MYHLKCENICNFVVTKKRNSNKSIQPISLQKMKSQIECSKWYSVDVSFKRRNIVKRVHVVTTIAICSEYYTGVL